MLEVAKIWPKEIVDLAIKNGGISIVFCMFTRLSVGMHNKQEEWRFLPRVIDNEHDPRNVGNVRHQNSRT